MKKNVYEVGCNRYYILVETVTGMGKTGQGRCFMDNYSVSSVLGQDLSFRCIRNHSSFSRFGLCVSLQLNAAILRGDLKQRSLMEIFC